MLVLARFGLALSLGLAQGISNAQGFDLPAIYSEILTVYT